jgi:hypothetical protein
MTTTLLILGGCALLLVPTLLFLLVVQPVWAFVEVCGAALLGRGAKIVWLLLLLVFAIVASIPYALFVSASAALRQITIVSLILIGVVIGVGYGVIRSNPHLQSEVTRVIEEARSSYAQVKDISEAARKLRW